MKEIEYIQVGDYLLPNLKVEEIHLNRFGRAKLDYLKNHDYGIYFKLLSKNELNDYLLKVQKEADDYMKDWLKNIKSNGMLLKNLNKRIKLNGFK